MGVLVYTSSVRIVCLYAFYTGDRMVGNRSLLHGIDSYSIPLGSILVF